MKSGEGMGKLKKILYCTIKAVFTGAIVGLFIGLYQFIGNHIVSKSDLLFSYKTPLYIIIMIAVSLVIFLISNNLVKRESSIAGSGIPYMELVIQGKYELKYYRCLPFMLLNSLFAFFMGFNLGSEGPSVLMGGNVGIATNKFFKDDDKQNVAVAAGCGFGCAFLSPLAGTVYCFEEALNHHFNYKLVYKMVISMISAYCVTILINNHKLLDMEITAVLRYSDYWILFILILINSITAAIFTISIIKMGDFVRKHRKNFFIKNRLFFAIILFLVLSFFVRDYLGGGSKIIEESLINHSLKFFICLFVFRFVLTIISSSSNISGGLLVPMFTLGAINGAIIYQLFSNYLDSNCLNMLVLLSVLIVFSSVTKSPLTAITLAFTVANFKIVLFPILIVIIGSHFLYKLSFIDDIYELLKKRIIKNNIE